MAVQTGNTLGAEALERLRARQVVPTSPIPLTTTVGSYPIPDWLAAFPSEQALRDATRVVFATQRDAGIDLPTDGELYRFDINHPDTNGMIDYFVGRMSGIRTRLGRAEREAYAALPGMGFRARPAGVVEGPVGEGHLDLYSDCVRAAELASGPFKFTVTSPYMLAKTLLDSFYHSVRDLTVAIADALAAQVRGLPCACLQVDEANLPGHPQDASWAAAALNRVLDAVEAPTLRAVHLCFGNYAGQVIQRGTWQALIDFLNQLHVDHLVLELARRPDSDWQALTELASHIRVGVGVVDIKENPIETPDVVAGRIERAARLVGPERIAFVHPDCGFWMLRRSVADRKMAALVAGRDRYLGTAAP
ncbi:MAG: methionine synthase [Pirellulaceae bacterium]|nr:MAG: methionine synthase [Pirellulaceae bacterium]